MSHLRAPAARADRREGGRHGRPVARPAPSLPDTPSRPQFLRLAVLPPVAVALGGAAAVLFTVRSTGARPSPSLWAVLAGALSVTLAAVVIAAVAATRAAAAVHDRIDALRRGTARREAELRALVDGLRQGEVPPRPAPHRGPPAGADEFELLAAELARAHDGAVAAVVRAAQLSSQAGSEQKLEVFLNLARRLQSLVHREISILDELENEIEDPDLLKGLFHVDHLATRIRRHAENLAVLGGAVSRRQWSNPVSMTEVLRSAIAEVEQYSRVKLVPPVAGTLRGHAVADVIHLLAELVENATLFSAPQTQVLLRADLVTSGLAVEVEDRGLGMPMADQARMNALLADPDQFNVASLLADGRIGLFVVSQLARRHGISVRLQSNIYGGVQAVLVVPQALLGAPHGDPDDARTPLQPASVPAGTRRPPALPQPLPAHRPGTPDATGAPGRGMLPSPRHAAGAHGTVPEAVPHTAVPDAGSGRHAGPYASEATGGHPRPTAPDAPHPGAEGPSGSAVANGGHRGTAAVDEGPSGSPTASGGHRGAAALDDGPSGVAAPNGGHRGGAAVHGAPSGSTALDDGRRVVVTSSDGVLPAAGAYTAGAQGVHAGPASPGVSPRHVHPAVPAVDRAASGESGSPVGPAVPGTRGEQAGHGPTGAQASGGYGGSASAGRAGDARPAPAGSGGAPATLPRRSARGQRPNPADAAPGIKPEYRPVVATTAAMPLTPRVGAVRGTMGRPQLPRRRAQEHIVPQLRGGPAPRHDSEEPVGHDPGLMAAFQRGIGLAEARQYLEPDHPEPPQAELHQPKPLPERTSPEQPGPEPLHSEWTSPEVSRPAPPHPEWTSPGAPRPEPPRPEPSSPRQPRPRLHSEWTSPEPRHPEPPRPEQSSPEQPGPEPFHSAGTSPETPHPEPPRPERTSAGASILEPPRPEPPHPERNSAEVSRLQPLHPEWASPERPQPKPPRPEWGSPEPAGPEPVRDAEPPLPAGAFAQDVPATGAPLQGDATATVPGAVPATASTRPRPDGARQGAPPSGDDLTARPDGTAPAG